MKSEKEIKRVIERLKTLESSIRDLEVSEFDNILKQNAESILMQRLILEWVL